jgi:hypothetical protein
MKVTMEKGKLGALELDLRVRERMIAKGVLEPKTLDKYLGDLPDREAQAVTIDVPQPALTGAMVDDDDDDDDADES